LPEQGDKRPVSEITDFDWYVEHIAATPDAAHFAVTGITTATGRPKRLIHLYDGATGKFAGSIPTTLPPGDGLSGMRFDPKGTRLHVMTDDRHHERLDIFEVPSLRLAGSVSELNAVNAGVSRWVTYRTQTSDTPAMIVLRERERPAPLLRVARDVEVAGAEGIKFSPDGNQIVWGNEDGTVTICDLNEVQRRLAEFGLGW
jgi:hypothetical protein